MKLLLGGKKIIIIIQQSPGRTREVLEAKRVKNDRVSQKGESG